jgi:hypothetical protein
VKSASEKGSPISFLLRWIGIFHGAIKSWDDYIQEKINSNFLGLSRKITRQNTGTLHFIGPRCQNWGIPARLSPVQDFCQDGQQ